MPDIDNLSIKIEASVEKALPAFDKLISTLNTLNSTITRSGTAFGMFTANISQANLAVKGLGNSINSLNIEKIYAKLTTLSQIDLSNLNKTLDFKFQINGDEVKATEEAFRATSDRLKQISHDTAQSIINDYHIADKKTQEQVRSFFDSFAKNNGRKLTQTKGFLPNLYENSMFTNDEAGAFKNGIVEAENQWEKFLAYMNTHKVKYIQEVKEMANANQLVGRGFDMTRYFSKNGTIDLESTEDAVRLAREFSNILSESEMKAANIYDRAKMVADAIRAAKDETLRTSANSQGIAPQLNEDFTARANNFLEQSKAVINEVKSHTGNKIMLDVGINEEKFAADIRKAIDKAAKATYKPIDLNLKINASKIKESIAEQFKDIDVAKIGALAEALKQLNITGANLEKLKGLDFTNIVRQFGKLSTLEPERLLAVATAIKAFIEALQMPMETADKAAGISEILKTISSFGRKNVETAILNMPQLGNAIQSMLTSIASAPEINAATVASLMAISQMNFRQISRDVTRTTSSGDDQNAQGSALQRNVGSVAKGVKGAVVVLNQALRGLGQTVKRISIPVLNFFKSLGATALNKIKGLASSIGDLTKRFLPFGKRAETATLSIRGLVNAAMRLYARIFMIRRALSLLTSSISSSMDYIESYHYFEVAMGKIGKQAKDSFAEAGYESADAYMNSFRDRALELNEKMSGFAFDDNGNAYSTGEKSLGLDSDQLLQYQAQYAQMADSIGMTEEAALATSKALAMLAGDWSSLRNIDFKTSYEKMSSALAGQSRAVRALGIDITQAALAETAANLGIETSVQKMSQAEKAQLRMITMINQSKVAWGDLANTLNTPANQMRMLQQNTRALARTFGNLFLPIVAKVIPYINGLVIALQRLFQWVAKLLGVNPGDSVTSMGGMDDSLGDLSDDLGDLDDSSLGDLADDAGDAEDALEDADKAAKELKRTILAFDELNVLNAPDISTDSDSGKDDDKDDDGKKTGLSDAEADALDKGLLDALADYEKAWNDAFDKMSSKAHEFAKKLEDLGRAIRWFWENAKFRELGEYLANYVNKGLDALFNAIDWDKIKSKIVPAVEAFAEVMNGLIDGINWSGLGSWIAGGINTFFSTLYAWFSNFDFYNLGRKLQEAFTGLVDNVDFGVIGDYLGAKFMSAWDLLAGFVENFPAERVGSGLAELANHAIAYVNPVTIGGALRDIFNGAFGTFGSFLENFDPNNDLARKLAVGLNTFFSGVDWKQAGKTLSDTINKAFDELKTFIEGFSWPGFSQALGDGINSFIYGVDAEDIASTIDDLLTNALGSVKESGVDWESLGRKVAKFIGGIHWYTHFLTIKSIIKEALSGFFSGLLSEALGDFGENFATGFIDGVDRVISFGAGTVKAVAEAFGFLAEKIGYFTPGSVHLFGEVCGILATVTIATGLGARVQSFAKGLVGLNSATAAANAANVTGYAGAIKTLTSRISSLLGTTGIGAAAAGAGMGYLAVLGADIQSLGEKMSGYNGKLSEIGTAMQDSLINMQNAGTITTEQHEELLKIIDDCENAGLSMDETSQALVTKMSEYGISTEQFERMLVTSMDHSEEAVNSLSDAAQNLGDGFELMASGLDVSGTEAADNIGAMRTAINEALLEVSNNGSEFQYNFSEIMKSFDSDIAGASENGQQALDSFVTSLKENWGASDEAITEFTDTVKTKLPGAVEATVGVFESLGDKAGTAQSEIDPLNTILDSMASETSWSDSLKLALIVGALGTLADNGEDADGKLSALSERLSTVSQNTSFQDMVGEISTSLQTAGTDSDEFYSALETAMSEAEVAVPESISQIISDIEGSGSELKSTSEETFKNVGEGAKTGLNKSIPELKKVSSNLAKDGVETPFIEELQIHSPSKVMDGHAYNAGKGAAEGLTRSIEDVRRSSRELGRAIPASAIDGLNDGKETLFASISDMVRGISERFVGINEAISNNFIGLDQNIRGVIGDLSPIGQDVGLTIANGLSGAYDIVVSGAQNLYNAISQPFQGIYNLGEAFGRDFAIGLSNGLRAVHISIPHIIRSNDTVHTYDGGSIVTPNFDVQWYAKGGLFTKPTLAGFGEAGNEAALPLTNKAVMSQIAHAITDSGGYSGLSPEEMSEAVATGVAMAMAQNPQTVEVVVQSILKMNDEAVAQAVERGRARLDMRYNASPGFGY